MPLEGLFRLVEELRVRIEHLSATLRQNEMVTRYVLIDPLLRGLGWDTEDPEQVIPEYRSGTGKADYALLKNGKPIILIEAKRLDTPLQDGLAQAINYCLTEGTLYFAVTDGRRWEVYETHKPVPISDKRLVEFDLVADVPAELALKALALWRRSVESGRLHLAHDPLVTTPIESSQAPLSPPISPRDDELDPAPAIRPEAEPTIRKPALAWNSLSKIQAVKFGDPPQMLRFPDGSEEDLRNTWVNLPCAVVKWLSDKGILTRERCPIRHRKRYLVHVTPAHPEGKPFTSPKQAGHFYVEGNYNGPDQLRTTIIILRHLSQDPDQFSVHF